MRVSDALVEKLLKEAVFSADQIKKLRSQAEAESKRLQDVVIQNHFE